MNSNQRKNDLISGINRLKDVLTGKTQITNRLKFHVLIGSIASVHVFLLVIFYIFRIMPLFYFNIGSVLSYAVCFWLMSGDREYYLAIYLITFIEVLMHSFATTICLGWKFGFAQYIIAIVPVSFYICYNLNVENKKFTIATLAALVSTVSFVACKLLSFFNEPLITIDNRILELCLYIFNSLCAFVFLTGFSLIFVFDMRQSSGQLKHQNAILNKLASTDPLTGLYNRRSMDVFLNQAVESESRFALIMCDIDNFKKVNDTYGHDFGDVVLKGIASITSEHVKGHGYVCRWGGEEILILINNASKESSFYIAENIRKSVANRVFELNEKWIHCSITLGVALYNGSEPVEETITRADYNLYCGKRNGKNAVVL